MFYIALSSVWRREVHGRRVRAVALQHVTGMRLNLDGSVSFHVKLIGPDGHSLESRSVRVFKGDGPWFGFDREGSCLAATRVLGEDLRGSTARFAHPVSVGVYDGIVEFTDFGDGSRFFSRRFMARFRPGRALPYRWTEAA